MIRRVVVRPAAEAELDEARRWYERRRSGLGEDFVACIDRAIEQIRELPDAPRSVHANVRRVLVTRFPYGVFYLVEEDRIVIIAVFHASRDPSVWTARK